jgi:hypothetical protein
MCAHASKIIQSTNGAQEYSSAHGPHQLALVPDEYVERWRMKPEQPQQRPAKSERDRQATQPGNTRTAS